MKKLNLELEIDLETGLVTGKVVNINYSVTAPENIVLDTKIDDIDLPIRVTNILRAYHCHVGDIHTPILTLRDLIKHSSFCYSSQPAMGKKSFGMIQEVLKEYGLVLPPFQCHP